MKIKKQTNKIGTTRKKMQSIKTDLSELIPQSISISEARPARRVKSVSVRPREGWDAIRTRKQHPLTSPAGLIDYYYRQVKANLLKTANVSLVPDASDSVGAGRMLDLLLSNHCDDELTVKCWIDWYVKQMIASRTYINPKVLRVRSMADSWPLFAPIRPASPHVVKTIQGAKRSVEKPIIKTISRELDQILSEGINEMSVSRALYRFGVAIVAQRLLSTMPEIEIANLIGTILDKRMRSMNGREDVRLIYNVSCRHQCGTILDRKAVFYDWVERFQKFWKWADCHPSSPEEYYANRAEEFFRGIMSS